MESTRLSSALIKFAVENNPVGKLILVTAINPMQAGKSTITIGLADALNKIGKKTMIAIREPSLGPVMGSRGSWCGLCPSVANGRHQPPLPHWRHAYC